LHIIQIDQTYKYSIHHMSNY